MGSAEFAPFDDAVLRPVFRRTGKEDRRWPKSRPIFPTYQGLPGFRPVAEPAHGPLADSGVLMFAAVKFARERKGFPHRAGSAFRVWHAEAADGTGASWG
jgi:hypothetical protein